MAVRPIDGNSLIEWFRPYLHTGEPIPADVVIEDIRSMPTLTQPKDSTSVQHGRWVKPVPGDGENYCSVCHTDQPWFYGYGYYDSDYCPNCGARMDAKEELKDGKGD